MGSRNAINRRKFIGSAAATAATITVLPRYVLGGPGFTAPSDKITIANIGCGTQGLREMPSLLQNPDIQVVAVCDPNRLSDDYLDWSPEGIRSTIRNALDEPGWGAGYKGIPGGREIAKEFVEKYYGRNKPSGNWQGCRSYEDYRELLGK